MRRWHLCLINLVILHPGGPPSLLVLSSLAGHSSSSRSVWTVLVLSTLSAAVATIQIHKFQPTNWKLFTELVHSFSLLIQIYELPFVERRGGSFQCYIFSNSNHEASLYSYCQCWNSTKKSVMKENKFPDIETELDWTEENFLY